ncbi:hypothetical protein [Nesterenkonia pannonica]|uniref:hypothetical protein n=1 Tax=Nesterenkonia pannonica TaxID=1548602 RepID=UPI00216418BA|nr:hypothetical protein [Nesterenkonia pannonica]
MVIKPSLSAGAVDTELLRADSLEAKALGARILGAGRTVMIQPEIPELSEGLEKAVYFIDGKHTHTIAKGHSSPAAADSSAGGTSRIRSRSRPRRRRRPSAPR